MSKYQIGEELKLAKEDRNGDGHLMSDYPMGAHCEVIGISHAHNTSSDYDLYTVMMPDGKSHCYCSEWLTYRDNVKTNEKFCNTLNGNALVCHLMKLKCTGCAGDCSNFRYMDCENFYDCSTDVANWLKQPSKENVILTF